MTVKYMKTRHRREKAMRPHWMWIEEDCAYFAESLPVERDDPLISFELVEGYVVSVDWEDEVDGLANSHEHLWEPIDQPIMILR